MNKVMSLHDAVAQYIQSGDTICFGGFTTNRKPYAAMYEILRQGQTDFTVWAGPAGGDWDMMIGEGRVKAYINCYTANSGYTNVSRRFRAFIEQGKLTYGNVNSTCIYGKGDYVKPQTRFTGSGGANGIATYCNTIIMMQHQKRRFMDHIDYVTSPGWMDGPGGRERAGLPGNRGPQMVVTDLGIMKFDDETKRMYLAYYYPFSSPEMVQENTGFEVDVSRAQLMEGPSPDIIKLIREEIDPGQAFIKVPKE